APEGQNWGFSPTDPIRLRASGYQYFIDLLRKNLRYGGAIRLDHVMVLFRLFWIPRGLPASKGAYVYYPADDLLAILALESVRAGTLVIGEDLGTVPDWVRERLGQMGVLSYRVFYFERTETGDCKPPHWYPVQSLAVVTTHDLPTLRGYWEACDIDARAKLGLIPTEDGRSAALAERRVDQHRWLAALKSEGLLPTDMPHHPDAIPVMTQELAQAIHQFLARTPARLVLANVEDVIATREQVNLPGTLNEHPNWRRKLNLTVEALLHDSRFEQLAARMHAERSSTSA
ncbi:MAG: 4-alpha-glucanotransferase, partial [Nitrospira sp.]|nr:4-alpha-glucanotransferase [Nitrospira sp.]